MSRRPVFTETFGLDPNNVPLFGNKELDSLVGVNNVPRPGWLLIFSVLFAGVMAFELLRTPSFKNEFGLIILVNVVVIGIGTLLFKMIYQPRGNAKARTTIGSAIAQRQEYIRHAERRLQQEQAKTFDPLSLQQYAPDSVSTSMWEVILNSNGSQRINVIRIVREQTRLGLKEAKDLVEAAPSTILVTDDEGKADSIRYALEKVGASVSVVSRTATQG